MLFLNIYRAYIFLTPGDWALKKDVERIIESAVDTWTAHKILYAIFEIIGLVLTKTDVIELCSYG